MIMTSKHDTPTDRSDLLYQHRVAPRVTIEDVAELNQADAAVPSSLRENQ